MSVGGREDERRMEGVRTLLETKIMRGLSGAGSSKKRMRRRGRVSACPEQEEKGSRRHTTTIHSWLRQREIGKRTR